jgi:hypothetical protein
LYKLDPSQVEQKNPLSPSRSNHNSLSGSISSLSSATAGRQRVLKEHIKIYVENLISYMDSFQYQTFFSVVTSLFLKPKLEYEDELQRNEQLMIQRQMMVDPSGKKGSAAPPSDQVCLICLLSFSACCVLFM